MDACIKELYRIGIVPVVAIEDANDALPLAEALKKGGVSAIEITFRTEAAAEAIRTLTREMPDMTVGAGTVVTKEQADAAIAAGAKFIVSPGFQPALVAYVRERALPCVRARRHPARWNRPCRSASTPSNFSPPSRTAALRC